MDAIDLKMNYGRPESPINRADAQYPTLHYEGDEELDLPQSGEMTVKFRVKRETEEFGPNGECHYICDVEICSIEKVKGDEPVAPAKSGSDAADALDALMEAHEKNEPDEKY